MEKIRVFRYLNHNMPIPHEAKKVFSGEIFDVYQWEQVLFDGTTAVFEMLKRPNSVEVIATSGDKILVAEEEQPGRPPFYTLVGGRQEVGEPPEDAGKRELLEESGCASNDWELYKEFQPTSKIDWSVYIYIARNCQKTHEPSLDAGEKINILSLSFDDFVELATHENFRSKELTTDILKMRLMPGELEKFRQRICGM